MKQIYMNLATEIKRKISGEFTVSDLRIYGSCARDEDTEYSDVDVYVELDQTSREIKKKVQGILWRESLRCNRLITLLLLSKYEAEHSPLKSSPILLNIKKEGVRI